MRGLFFKVFIIFWIAQSLIFVISTAVILNRRFPRPEPFLEPMFAEVGRESLTAAASFEAGGCEAMRAVTPTRGRTIALADEFGHELCVWADPQAPPIPPISQALNTESTVRQMGNHYLFHVPVVSAGGRKYQYALWLLSLRRKHPWYEDLLHFAFPQLPVAIAVGGVTTFVLVLFFTRPVVRLRRAARELARGNLHARVIEPSSRARIFEGDEFQGLLHDFNHMAERLESLVAAQKLLLRDVSHELRSPLARLSVALELSREDADTKMATHLDRIERETKRLNQLIGQLLTLSSMEALESAGNFEHVSLKALLEEMIPDAEYEAQQREAAVVLHAECDCVIEGRRELLYRAIENVVRNAVRYTEAGTEVEIRLYAAQENGATTAILEVNDRGPGIPESETASIFRPFYRVDLARSTQTGGFGVGLAIADRAVKLHNGKLKATNRAGGGLSIEMRFPAVSVTWPTAATAF